MILSFLDKATQRTSQRPRPRYHGPGHLLMIYGAT